MGKKKQAQRTKNNVVPASSGRSAELLQSTSGVPFVGFSTLKEGGFIPILTGISDELDQSIGEEFRLVWKKMNKKDTTTKLKALDEFKKLCQNSDVEVVKPVLPYWPRLFSTLTTDEEHRVREAAHAAHRALVSKAGRNIAPFLKQLVGPWFTGQHDTYPPAASTAESAFQETFPPNKLVEVIVFCQYEILNYISNNLLDQTPQSLTNNQNCSQEVKDARYQRVVVSCLNGYALYLQRLPVEQLQKAEEANLKLVSSAKFWRFNKDPATIVRAAWFTALVALCEKAPFLLTQENKHVCMAVFSNIDETDPAVISSLWQAALLTFNVVEDVWKHVSLEKLVLPKLWKVLREGADGNASLVFPHLLPLLSKIPASLLSDKGKFYSKFFENLRSGLKVRNVQISAKESSAVVRAFLECLRYLISINMKEEKLCLALFEEQVFPLVEAVLSDGKLQLAQSCLFSGLANLANLWARQESDLHRTLTTCYWQRLAVLTETALRDHVTDHNKLASNCAVLDTLLCAMKNPSSHSRKSFRVKFVSSRKSTDEESEESSPTTEDSPFAPAFEQARSGFVKAHVSLCFNLIKSCGKKTMTVLIGHLATTLEEYDSSDMYLHVLSMGQFTWAQFYQQKLAHWLRDDKIPLDYNLRIIFTLLKYVEDKNEVQLVYTDLSGEETLAFINEVYEPQLQPLYVKWQDILEWALKAENQTACVKEWVVSHGGVCRLAALLRRHDPSYNILHNCLRNLRQTSWLTTEALATLVSSLRHNLLDPSVDTDVKMCSSDLLYAMLQNKANHKLLACLPTQALCALLYELFTASLQRKDHFPQCWQHCLSVLSDTELSMATVCETCVDLLVAVVKTSPMDLSESQKLVCMLEDLVMAAGGTEDVANSATMLDVVLSRLSARLRPDAETVWGLYIASEILDGALKGHSVPYPQFCSPTPKDPLAAIPLQQYMTSMIPFLMMVVRLHTLSDSDSSDAQFPYARLRAALPAKELWEWCIQVLQLQSLCISLKRHFISTKQYFLLRDKITFILEECGLFSQLRVKELLKHLGVSLFEEEVSSLEQLDSLYKLQREVTLKDLDLLYNIHQIQKDLLPFKSKSNIVKQYYFPEEVLEEISSNESLEKKHLPHINACHNRLVTLHKGNDLAHKVAEATNISILDRVFDQYVAEEREDRSLLHLPDEELLHIAEVADFSYHSVMYASAHMKQSSWDASLVATAALCHSVATTLEEWQAKFQPLPPSSPSPPSQDQSQSSPSFQPWPFNLLDESKSTSTLNQNKEHVRLPLVRVIRSVCRLFDALSAHLEASDPEDKAAATRRTEWADVFLPDTHTALTDAWLKVADVPCNSPTSVVLIEALSCSVARYVQYPHFVIHKDTLDSLDTCCRLLQSSETSIQLAAYHLLLRLIPAMVELDMKQCESDNIALSCQHVDKTLLYTQTIIDVILSGLSFGDLCIVEPFTDSYTYSRCYLLLWIALLELCSQACSQLRALYTTWLKEEYLPVFMKTVFCLMPEAALHGEITSQRIAQLFSKPHVFDKGVWSSERLAQLSCWVFACSLRRLPAAIRQWWNEADHRVYALVEHVTATYVSPDLCADEMRAIQTQEKKFDNMTVHVHATAKEVYAVYTLEESRMELVIELAHNHPLGLVKIRSGQRMVSTAQTRQWLLQITILLTHQNGSIWDALELWKNSLDKRFEGVEECYICFAILHSVSHQLPKLSCQTCRKKFHSVCLYKWFTTSNKSTCPICRNLF